MNIKDERMGEKRWFLCKPRVTVSSDQLCDGFGAKNLNYYPPEGMALLAVMMFMSLSEREYVNWSDKNNGRKDFKKLHIIADLVNR